MQSQSKPALCCNNNVHTANSAEISTPLPIHLPPQPNLPPHIFCIVVLQLIIQWELCVIHKNKNDKIFFPIGKSVAVRVHGLSFGGVLLRAIPCISPVIYFLTVFSCEWKISFASSNEHLSSLHSLSKFPGRISSRKQLARFWTFSTSCALSLVMNTRKTKSNS